MTAQCRKAQRQQGRFSGQQHWLCWLSCLSAELLLAPGQPLTYYVYRHQCMHCVVSWYTACFTFSQVQSYVAVACTV